LVRNTVGTRAEIAMVSARMDLTRLPERCREPSVLKERLEQLKLFYDGHILSLQQVYAHITDLTHRKGPPRSEYYAAGDAVRNLESSPPETLKPDELEKARERLTALRAELEDALAANVHSIEQLRAEVQQQGGSLAGRYIGGHVSERDFNLRAEAIYWQRRRQGAEFKTYRDKNSRKEKELISWIIRVNATLDAATRSRSDLLGLLDKQLCHCSAQLEELNKQSGGKDKEKRLHGAVKVTLAGMIGCWLAQWVFWVGFIRLHQPDQ
jgi:DNA repair exonuclease SbcCD ATPase subunit